MKVHLSAPVLLYGKSLMAYGGPSLWDDVPYGIYFESVAIDDILGRGLASIIDAETPEGATATVYSGWDILNALHAADNRSEDAREIIIATRQADQAFGNAPKGYSWQAI